MCESFYYMFSVNRWDDVSVDSESQAYILVALLVNWKLGFQLQSVEL